MNNSKCIFKNMHVLSSMGLTSAQTSTSTVRRFLPSKGFQMASEAERPRKSNLSKCLSHHDRSFYQQICMCTGLRGPMTSEVMDLSSKLNSVTLITYVPVLFWHSGICSGKMSSKYVPLPATYLLECRSKPLTSWALALARS